MDKEEQKKGSVLTTVVKNCTISMGAINDKGKIAALYDQHFLLADLTFVLVQLRIWGVDPVYVYEHQCPFCENIDKHHLDLRTLRVDQQKDEYRGKTSYAAIIKDAPKPFGADGEILKEADWSYGDVPITFRPLFMRDSFLLETIRSDYPKQKATRELALQIESYCGVDGVDINLLRKFDSSTRSSIREEIEKVNGGVNSEAIMSCRKCTRSYKDSIPVTAKYFFFRVGVTPETRKATPFLENGTTPTSSLSDSTGPQVKSSDSASKSASST